MRDTSVPHLHPLVWAEVKPKCEAALSALGAGGAVWARTMPQGKSVTPRCILGGDQVEATTYQSLDKYGLGFDLEVRCISDVLKQASDLVAEVKPRVTDLDDPPEPDGYTHRYTKPLDTVSNDALSPGQSDLFEFIVRARLIYRTAN